MDPFMTNLEKSYSVVWQDYDTHGTKQLRDQTINVNFEQQKIIIFLLLSALNREGKSSTQNAETELFYVFAKI